MRNRNDAITWTTVVSYRYVTTSRLIDNIARSTSRLYRWRVMRSLRCNGSQRNDRCRRLVLWNIIYSTQLHRDVARTHEHPFQKKKKLSSIISSMYAEFRISNKFYPVFIGSASAWILSFTPPVRGCVLSIYPFVVHRMTTLYSPSSIYKEMNCIL